MPSEKHCQTFPLRIPASTRAVAAEHARRSGVSLNYFILVAISERISRLDAGRGTMPFLAPRMVEATGAPVGAQVIAIDERP